MQHDFLLETVAERRLILAEWLSQGECVVTFRKVNGEIRDMPCTLQAEMLPVQLAESTRKPNPDVMLAFLVDKQAWRSFRLDNVISVRQV
jgi:hypothetical protein